MKRIASIDVFRALTMFLMIWVNDFWTLDHIPKWLQHAAAGEDYLGFSDLIFPWFLFIVGMSIPYAFENRFRKGKSMADSLVHILFRTIALLVMGLFHVNMEQYNPGAALLSKSIYVLITTAAFFMIWNRYPETTTKKRYLYTGLRLGGIGILIVMFLLYRGQGYDGAAQGFKTHWWGILGLIGWVYLICASVYLLFRRSLTAAVIALLVSLAINIISSSGIPYNIFSWQSGNWIPGSGGLQALAFGGIIASLLLMKTRENQGKLYAILLAAAALTMVAGILLRGEFMISKISGTPTWILLSMSTALLLFVLLHFIVDVKGYKHWFLPIKTAGTATLTCYLVPYFYYSFRSLTGAELPDFLTEGWVGLIKSFIYAFLIIGMTWLLTRMKIQLKI